MSQYPVDTYCCLEGDRRLGPGTYFYGIVVRCTGGPFRTMTSKQTQGFNTVLTTFLPPLTGRYLYTTIKWETRGLYTVNQGFRGLRKYLYQISVEKSTSTPTPSVVQSYLVEEKRIDSEYERNTWGLTVDTSFLFWRET